MSANVTTMRMGLSENAASLRLKKASNFVAESISGKCGGMVK